MWDVVVVSDLNKNIGGSTDLVKKRHGSADFYTPIHSPRLGLVKVCESGRLIVTSYVIS